MIAHAPGHEPGLQLICYAGTIVHEACHRVRYEESVAYSCIYPGMYVSPPSLSKGLFLNGQTGDFRFLAAVLIDGANDPENQY